jgi:hypothetical protein
MQFAVFGRLLAVLQPLVFRYLCGTWLQPSWAGELIAKCVQMFASMQSAGFLSEQDEAWRLTGAGERFVAEFGIDLSSLVAGRAPLCRSCLDWSERRTHLAGALGRVMLLQMAMQEWVKRDGGGRVLVFSRAGEAAFNDAFGMSLF